MELTLDDSMAWKAEEMTMNTSSPCVAKSRDLVADFKKGIKQDAPIPVPFSQTYRQLAYIQT
jgi:hypothetical protein